MRRLEQQREAPVPITGGTSNFSRAAVPYGVDLTAAWSWRLLVIAAAGALLGWLIGFFTVVVIPVVVALLITALVTPVVQWLVDVGVPMGLVIASIHEKRDEIRKDLDRPDALGGRRARLRRDPATSVRT